MAALTNVDISLKELIDEIEKGNFLIPKFQRDFVWRTPDIESLGDSIVRGYPISSMLTMPANGTLKLTASPLKTHGAIDSGGQPNYVLDGQQRITSLAKLFLGYDEKKDYYFDMLSILDDMFPEDAIRNMPPIYERLKKGRNDRRNGYSSITSDLCRSFDKKSGGEGDFRQNYRFIHGRLIIQNRFGSAVTRFLRAFEGMPDELLDKYTDYLNAVFGAMGSYGIPLTKINAESDLSLVIRVFEKVNTSGKKLTLFDLVNAKSFESANPSYQIGLADFISESLRVAAENRNYRSSAINLFFGGNGKTYSDLAPFIRCASIADHLSKDLFPSITNKEMLDKNADHWFGAWQEYSDTILKFISRLDQERFLTLINGTFLEYATAIVMVNSKLLDEPVFIKEIKRYALDLILSGQTFNKSNLDVVMELHKLGKHLVNAHEFEKNRYPFSHYSTTISPDRMEQWGVGRQQFKAIMYILYSEKAGGKFTIDLEGNSIKESNIELMDQHHLYPKAKIKREEEKIFNSVANIVMLNRACNQREIKDKHPYLYLRELKSIHGSHAEYIFSQNVLPESMWKNEAADPRQVLKDRLKNIADIVNDYFSIANAKASFIEKQMNMQAKQQILI
ncbi:DUF262 domain-containing protein [Allochromatium humboldtianum]|uniref:DUF262 domain-containing protein n=1 Tax=Allochromatium humboldtianum TaxID=504901 RepID=A0A850RE66_9GAMM|nr:DUF262 domain-containing protein [Allochromatium humboldtianum]NVZ11648.1 DUF262 domain-containing protein [Allochromatium humboldtianum]